MNWISIKEFFPPSLGSRYLIVTIFNAVHIGMFDRIGKDGYFFETDTKEQYPIEDITHFCNIPAIPRKESKDDEYGRNGRVIC
jgi:hypothetical protein